MLRTHQLQTFFNRLLALSLTALLIAVAVMPTRAQDDCRLSMRPCTCATPAPGMVAWWTGDDTAEDVLGGNHGTLQNGAGFTRDGEVGSAFSFDGIDDFVKVPGSSRLDVGAGGGFTIETWVNTSDVVAWQPLVEWNRGDAYGVHLWLNLNEGGQTSVGGIYANIVGTDRIEHRIDSGEARLQPNAFHHVALTFDKASGATQLYLDGIPTGQPKTFLGVTPETSFNLYLGRRPGGGEPVTQFSGAMDEVSIYDRALKQQEIEAIAHAARSGKCRYAVSGRVADNCGFALAGAAVTAQSARGTLTRSTTTDAQGNYALMGLPGGADYVITPQVPAGQGGGFAPPFSSFSNLSVNQTADFFFQPFRPAVPKPCPAPFDYVSDLLWAGVPINYGQEPQRDTSHGDGQGNFNPITLNGVVYAKGLGVHAYSEVTYNLWGRYSTFISNVGVDDEPTANNGSIVFIVVADGNQVFNSGEMYSTSPTQTVNVSVAGVQELKLIVTDAGNGIISDHGDWADARLVR
jgi:hypothetical protein